MRNFLLDKRFQLKYTGFLVGITLVLSLALGLVLWRTSSAVIEQSQQVVQRGREVVTESKKVSAVVEMTINDDPDYKDNPALKAAFDEGASKQNKRLLQQQKQLELQDKELKQRRTTYASALTGILALLVIGIGMAGIVVTHRIAGPIFKMKRQFRELGEGKMKMPYPLRKGDELVEFFAGFETMVKSLRDRQAQEIATLDEAIGKLESKVSADDLAPLHELRATMQAELDG